MTTHVARPGKVDVVEATLAYLKPMAKKPVRYLCEPPPGEPEMNWETDFHRVFIRDARMIAGQPSLEREGFLLRRADVPGIDFDDEAQVRSSYYPEIEQIVRAVTNATSVIAFDHNVRSGSKEARKMRRAFPPARNVHADYTFKSGPQRIRDIAGRDLPGSGTGYAEIINVWRPLNHQVETDALAVLDAESVAQDDLLATDLKYADRTGEFYSVTFSPRHRWYYFSRMDPEEMLIFKCFDSRDAARANCVPHVAFEDPDAGFGARPRESIEVRTIALFDRP
jgi:hypothetical protein